LFQINTTPGERFTINQLIHAPTTTHQDNIKRDFPAAVTGAAGASIAGTAALIGLSTIAHAAKVPQKAVKYQDTPKVDQRCDNCLKRLHPARPSMAPFLRRAGASSATRNPHRFQRSPS
jgi:hypothetical protein